MCRLGYDILMNERFLCGGTYDANLRTTIHQLADYSTMAMHVGIQQQGKNLVWPEVILLFQIS